MNTRKAEMRRSAKVKTHPLALAAAVLSAGLSAGLAVLPAGPLAAQDSAPESRQTAPQPLRPDTYLDPVAARLHASAAAQWQAMDTDVVRYTALIRQRLAAQLRMPLKDRTLYRNETAVRAFWDRDYEPLVQVLGTRTRYPGRERALEEGMDFLDDLPFDEPFEPGDDRLFFGLSSDDEAFEDGEADFWLAHPLAPGADSLYRFRSGDTLTLSLPDGRSLQTVRLDVLPREADVHRISGTLRIEPESGALVQAVYRLSREFDALRDLDELRAEDEAGEFRMVPGFLKPWTFDMKMVAIEYGLWDFKVWLPRTMRVEGQAAAGILKFPVSFDVAYRIESVTLADELEAEKAAVADAAAGQPRALTDRHFETRAEAMAFIARLLSEENGVEYRTLDDAPEGRNSRWMAPTDLSALAESEELPPPIWEEAPGFATADELSSMLDDLGGLPQPTPPGLVWAANWGWERADLLRYNRVEGPALGGRVQARFGAGFLGPLDLSTTGYFGFADLEPKVRLDLERASLSRRIRLGGFRELRATDPDGRYLQLGNSLNALLFGRDDGEYFLATGADLTVRPAEADREVYRFRAYAERQDPVSSEISFSLAHAFDGGWAFRPNITADAVEEVGVELRLTPWWGTDPLLPQFGLELYGQGAGWRTRDATVSENYARAFAMARAAIPLSGDRWRLGLEAGGGTTWGEAPLQRAWFLGGPRSLRGYSASTAFGSSFVRGRVELARRYEAATLSAFGDVGWAGLRDQFDTGDLLYGVGVGGSILDGLIRLDLSQGLTGSGRQFRVDLYLDAIL